MYESDNNYIDTAPHLMCINFFFVFRDNGIGDEGGVKPDQLLAIEKNARIGRF
jgi:hypothetical protein